MKDVILIDGIKLYRLSRCVERYKQECALDAPSVIKRAELALIKEICDELAAELK